VPSPEDDCFAPSAELLLTMAILHSTPSFEVVNAAIHLSIQLTRSSQRHTLAGPKCVYCGRNYEYADRCLHGVERASRT
jgi:hypothetical protein